MKRAWLSGIRSAVLALSGPQGEDIAKMLAEEELSICLRVAGRRLITASHRTSERTNSSGVAPELPRE